MKKKEKKDNCFIVELPDINQADSLKYLNVDVGTPQLSSL